MSNSTVKDIRKQIKNVVQDLLPGILQQELSKAVFEQVVSTLKVQLAAMENDVKTSLEDMQQRQKDVLGYLVRQSTASSLPQPGEVVDKNVAKEE